MSQSFAPRFRLATVLLVLYWIALFIATHIPVSGPVRHLPGGDKMAHLLGYAGLAYLFAFALMGRNRSLIGYAWVLGVVVAYGLADEWIQSFVGRSASIKDWIADVAGGVAGVSAHLVTALAWGALFPERPRPAESTAAEPPRE